MKRIRSLFIYLGGLLLVVFSSISPALADAPDVTKIENFAQNVIRNILIELRKQSFTQVSVWRWQSRLSS